jgi:hypothetical protein
MAAGWTRQWNFWHAGIRRNRPAYEALHCIQDEGEIGVTQSPKPNPDLKSLDRLVGTWKVSGGAQGQIRFEWMEGGFFLVQHFDLVHDGRRIKGIEVIGHQQRIREEPSKEIWTRVYSFLDGLTLDYVYELTDDTLTIWFGGKDSDNRFQGKFEPAGNQFSGAWEWPGGGYQVVGIRVL